MKYLVLAYDYTDKKAPERRSKAREAHLVISNTMMTTGKWQYAVAILDDNDKTIGSAIICNYDSRDDIENQWLKKEPYILEKVWERIEINKIHEGSIYNSKK